MRGISGIFLILAAVGAAHANGERRAPPSWANPRPAAAPPPQIILDPGHGGEDLGAVVHGKKEKDIALSVARRLQALLAETGGAAARLTRDSDVFLPLDERVSSSLLWGGKAFISLHVNEIRHKKMSGMTVYAYGRSKSYHRDRRRKHKVAPLAPPPRAQAMESAAFASVVARNLREEGLKVDPPGRAEFYVLKNPAIPSILIELGYLSNPAEAKSLQDPAYQDRLARTIASAVREYLDGTERVPPGVAAR